MTNTPEITQRRLAAQITVRVPALTYAHIEQIAEAKGVKVTDVVRSLIDWGLAELPDGGKPSG